MAADDADREIVRQWVNRQRGYEAYTSPEHIDTLAELVAAGRQGVAEAEREACAKLAEEVEAEMWNLYKRGHGPERADPHYQGMSDGAGRVAAAIRNRGA